MYLADEHKIWVCKGEDKICMLPKMANRHGLIAGKDDPLIEVDTIGLKGSPTNVFKSFTPPQKGAGTMLTGDDTAAQLAGILAKKHLI